MCARRSKWLLLMVTSGRNVYPNLVDPIEAPVLLLLLRSCEIVNFNIFFFFFKHLFGKQILLSAPYILIFLLYFHEMYSIENYVSI